MPQAMSKKMQQKTKNSKKIQHAQECKKNTKSLNKIAHLLNRKKTIYNTEK
jgi:hypothetical protein